MRKLSFDLGFGGLKAAEVVNGNVNVVTIPSVVGVGETDVGLLSVGLARGQRHKKPRQIAFDGQTYLVGDNVHRYARPVERTDFFRLSEGPEIRALIYAGLWQLLGAGQHTVAMVAGLPVEVMQNRTTAQETLRTLQRWLVGTHSFTVNGKQVDVEVVSVKIIAQPTGTLFEWGLTSTGQPSQTMAHLNGGTVGICDIGFNTVDLLAVQGSEVLARFTGGNTQGMRRAAAMFAQSVKQAHALDLSLHEADSFIQQGMAGKSAMLHTATGDVDVSGLAQQALDDTAGAATAFIHQLWEQGRQFQHLFLTGGGAAALRTHLLRQYPHAVILSDPVTANARGLAKFAQGKNVFK